MDNFKLLPMQSQGGDDVLYFDASRPVTELYDCAIFRMGIAKEMLESLSLLTQPNGEDAMCKVASAAAMLLSDAHGLFEATYPALLAYKRMGEGKPPAPGVSSIFRARSEALDGVD